jgi:hypothetical protein
MESFNQAITLENIRRLEEILIGIIDTHDQLAIALFKREIYPIYKAEVEKVLQLAEDEKIKQVYLE